MSGHGGHARRAPAAPRRVTITFIQQPPMRRLALALALIAPTTLAAQQTSGGNNFSWHGPIAAGNWITVRNLNGRVTVERSTDGQVEVTGTKHWRRGDPSEVRFVMQQHGANGDVLVCAVWGDGDCDEDGYHSHGRGTRNNDTNVEFVVKVPAGVRVAMSTVNGDVEVNGAGAEVNANTVNGDVTVTTAQGPVNASTVNGSVEARMSALAGDDDMTFSTVNGGITLALPASFQGEVDLSTVNGRFSTDYPLTVNGRIDPRHVRATIGSSRRRVKASTVNGSIELRKAGA